LKEIQKMRNNIAEQSKKDEQNIDATIAKTLPQSLLMVNNEKIRVQNENEKLQQKIREQNEYIRKLEKELIDSRSKMMGLYKNSDLLQGSLNTKEVEMNKLKAKAYGYDINKKLEYQQQRVKPYGASHYVDDDNNNLWENDNNLNGNMKLDQLAKERQMWIGNPSLNIDKLINNMDKSHKNHPSNEDASNHHSGHYYNNNNNYNNPSSNPSSNLNSNLRKYSPLILDPKQQSYNKNKY